MAEDYPLTSTHWGVYRAEVANGKLIKLHNFEEDVDPSPIGNGIVGTLDAPSRVTAPMVRCSWLEKGPGSATNLRGKDTFVEVTWDEVNRLIADELRRVKCDYGQNAIYAGSYGWASAGRFHHAQSQMKRFLNCIGGFTSSKNTYSFAAAEVIVPHILGNYRDHMNRTTSWRSIAAAAELVVAFGGIPVKNGQIESGGAGRHVQREGLRAARNAGVEFVNISPLRSDMESDLDARWWPARPTSDVAIMLGLAHTLYTEGLHDAAFLARYCSGFECFLPYLLGDVDGVAKDADWASALSEILAKDIRELAREMAAKRTVVSVSWSLTRSDHGEQPYWMAITLAAMLGQIGLEGGGIAFGFSAENSIGGDTRLTPGAGLPMGQNAVSEFIPVARITDLLENPLKNYQYDGEELQFPDIKLIWWSGGNPYHHHQDLNRLARAWQKPDTIIVNDWCWNATAKRADIVLPVTTPLEREDLQLSLRDPYIVAMKKVVEPPKNVRGDHQIFAGIATEMGVNETFTEGRSEEEWLRWLWDKTRQDPDACGLDLPDWNTLQKMGWYKTPDQEKPTVMMRDFRENPKHCALNTPSGKIEIYSDVVASFGYNDCPGHSVWQTPYEWLGNVENYPLHMISNQPRNKLHSQLDQGSVSASGKLKGREPVILNPKDAQVRGIACGDAVKVFNARGSALGIAVLSEDVRTDVIVMSTGAWWDPDEDGMCRHGNPNALTRDVGTSQLGQGPTAHSCLVEIERFCSELPRIEAFDPPKIIWRGS